MIIQLYQNKLLVQVIYVRLFKKIWFFKKGFLSLRKIMEEELKQIKAEFEKLEQEAPNMDPEEVQKKFDELMERLTETLNKL